MSRTKGDSKENLICKQNVLVSISYYNKKAKAGRLYKVKRYISLSVLRIEGQGWAGLRACGGRQVGGRDYVSEEGS